MYNIVTRPSLIDQLKKSRYWHQNLGLVTTLEHNGERTFNQKDKFSYFYNTRYNTNILMQGNIGDILIYIDYYIHEDVLALYYNQEEFIFNFDFKLVKDKGADFYLGHLLKKLETEYQDRIKQAEDKKIEVKYEPNVEKLFKNPGNVSYDDLKEFLKQKSEKNRFSN
jgi:hypothetical protein